MPSEIEGLLSRHDPAVWTRTLAYRPRHELPFDATAVSVETPVMLDTTVYIDALKAPGLPDPIAALIARNVVLHASVARGELVLAIGHLDPAHPHTARNRTVLQSVLAQMAPSRIRAPDPAAWTEASLITGILARIQGVARQARRALLNDALLLFTAIEHGTVLISRNIRDMDLLLRFRPEARLLLYDLDPLPADHSPTGHSPTGHSPTGHSPTGHSPTGHS